MLRSLKSLERHTVVAVDGDVGGVVDFMLDDEFWTVRYLVANTFEFLDGRALLVSPLSVRGIDWKRRRVLVTTTRGALMKGPLIDPRAPITRRQEDDFNRLHGFRRYWGQTGLWGMSPSPGIVESTGWDAAAVFSTKPDARPHLHLASEIRSFSAQACDAAIGRVEDLLVDAVSWQVRYVVMNIGSWWSARRVVIPPQWASIVSWQTKELFFDMSRETVRASPVLDTGSPVSREYERRVYDFYRRAGYWAEDVNDVDNLLPSTTTILPPRL